MSSSDNISWQIEIPLINNRFIIGNVMKGIALTLLLFFIIIGSIFGGSNGMKGVEQALMASLWAGLFLVIVSVFTLGVFLGNKYLLDFNINEEGVIMKSRSERAHFVHRLALIMGLLGRNMAAAGAGVAGVAGETSYMPWNKIKSIKVYPEKKTIRLKRNFLETIYVYCTEGDFESVSALIARKAAENKGRPDRADEGSPERRREGISPAKDISDAVGNAACPKCNAKDFSRKADDAARRLQAIPEKDKPTDEEFEAEIKRDEIVERLARPQEPQPFSLGRWVLLLLIPVVNIISIFFSPLLKGLKIFISVINSLLIVSVIWAAGFAGNYHEAQNLVAVIGLFMCMLYMICLVYSWNVAKADCRAKLPEYKRVLPRWEHLLYCDQCKVVFFDDKLGSSAPVEDVKSFLAGSFSLKESGTSSDIPRSAAVDKRVPLWLWIILTLVCAAGIAFFSIFCSPAPALVKEKLTPQQEAAVFSDIQEEKFKVSEPESSSEPLLPQKAGDGDGISEEIKNMEKTAEDFSQGEMDKLIARGATPESAQEAVDAAINKGDFSKLNKLNRLLENKNKKGDLP